MNSLKLVTPSCSVRYLHRLQRLVVDPADDLVEAVVDRALSVGLAVPLGQAVLHVLAGALHGQVDDRRDAAPRGGARARSRTCRRRTCRRTAAPCGCARRCRRGSRTCRWRRSPSRAPGSASAKNPGAPTAAIVSPSIRTSAALDAGGRDDLAVLDQRVCHRVGLLAALSARRSRRRRRAGGRGRTPTGRGPRGSSSRSRSRTISSGLCASPTSPTNCPSGSTK